MSDSLIVARSGHRTMLTLNRPERVNALDAALVEALLAALASAARDGTRIVVFRGAGKGFSAGFDFSGLDAQSDGDLVLRFIRLEQMLQAVWSAPFVTMAIAHGPCFGAAADLVAASTIRIASDDTGFRMPGLRFGIALGTA
ncbi:MAG: enoyl-CoA hydratase/isomerase family protein, partial [Hyphomicrobium sp.]